MSSRPFELLVGSKSRAKALEIRRLLADFPVQVLELSTLGDVADVPEEGETFEQNAIAKAVGFARMTGLTTLADDSGLEVDALGGRPGVYSARFAGAKADDQANNRKLIEQLANTPPVERTARYRCVIAVATSTTVLFTCAGSVEGVIMTEARGSNGFGYDPLFYYPEYGDTFGMVSPDMKDRVSHRSRALAQFKRLFSEYLLTQQK